MAADSTVRCVADVHAVLGEGPVWVSREQALYWLDVKGKKVFRLSESGDFHQWPSPFRIGAIAPRTGGGFIAGAEDGIAAIDLHAGRFNLLFCPDEEVPGNRFNDGKIDRQGRFWAGSMDDAEKHETGIVYRIDPSLSRHVIDRPYRVPNGPAFSPSGELMYLNDSAKQITYVFDLDGDGNATNRRSLIQFGKGDGSPDGVTVDAEGCLWIAFWDGWCVRRFSPDGELLQTIEMPVSKPTSCAFGGRDLNRLYISSASIDLSEDDLRMQPNAGGLFMIEPGVRGVEEVPFAG